MSRADQLLAEAESLAGFGVWEWDVVANRLWWSPALHRILGISETLAPSFELWLGNVHPDDLSTVKSYFSKARREPGLHEIEYRVVRGETVHTIQSRARSAPDRVVGVDQDTTKNKEVAARVFFSDRMVSIGTLAAGVSHEINNPLATIAANLQMLRDGQDMSLIESALASVDRIRSIVRGLGAFSRRGGEQRSSVDPSRVLELAISLATSELRHRARLVTKLGPLPHVSADEARLGQVFINLLVNAAEAIPEGNANDNEVRVTSYTDAAGWAIVEVRDTGAGIPREIEARIFDPFFTTKSVGRGTGLGLSICHGIVRSLGGDISFRSENGKGTTFVVALPPHEAPQRLTPPPQTVPTTSKRGSILIVDDEASFVNSLRRVFAIEHDVTTAGSGRHALARIQAGERFDVILCDLMMPEMTGAELHAVLGEIAPDQARRMIFVTGGAFTQASQSFIETVENPCFEKPCDLGGLRAEVRRVVDGK
jgi:signal transduction histidine kinase/CheY-like chemotaxis protein